MSDTQRIKDTIDIVDFVGEYLQLKPAGTNHKGLCPFHREKTPSFMVSRERQSWHCFGCHKGGDIFSFAQEIEGMEFIEALRLLAGRAGVPLTFHSESETQSTQKTRSKEINRDAARFFHHILLEMPQAQSARAYLKNRGLQPETIDFWQIGFIPDQWDLLTQYLLKKGHSIDDLAASGLTIERDGARQQATAGGRIGRGFYDRFRGRVMFPIHDVHGEIVGFTGRVLVETPTSGGKYVNTPQTAVYDKSRVIFGLYQAKQEIKAKNTIVMVEGQMDVIACHEAGMKNVVASSGTALTEHQVRLLARYAKNISIAFDADAAGQAAAKRGIGIALEAGMIVKVIAIPEGKGKDPDDCVRKYMEVWFRAVTEAKDVIAWYIDQAIRGKDIRAPHEKQAIVDEVVSEIARIPYAVEKDHWLRELGGRLGVDIAVLREDMARVKKQNSKSKIQKFIATGENQSETKSIKRLDQLVELILMLILRFPSLRLPIHDLACLGTYLSPSPLLELYEAIKMQYTNSGSIDPKIIRQSVVSDTSENIYDLLLLKADLEYTNLDEKEVVKEFAFLIEQSRAEWQKQRRQELQQKLAEAERAGDAARVQALIRAFRQAEI